MGVAGKEIVLSSVALFLIVSVLASIGTAKSFVEMDKNLKLIFNFNSESEFPAEAASSWYESSDTVR